jgi:hypothetical protein
VEIKGLWPLSFNLPSFKRLILFSFLLLVLFASVVYLRAGDEIEVPSELGIALSSVREDWDSWTSRVWPSISGNGDFPSGNAWQASSEAGGLVPLAQGDSGRNSLYAVYDVDSSSSPGASPILNFNSSVSPSQFRTWGNLTLQGGALPYLILNSTLWDGDLIVESTRYMMIEVEPGEHRDFDIRESCRLSPERGYSCILKVEEPEELFVSERRDCLIVEDDPKVVIWDEIGAARGRREAGSEKVSDGSISPSGYAKVASTSSYSKSTETSQEVEDSSEDLESEEEDLILDSSSSEQRRAETGVGSDSETDAEYESETEVETDYGYCYVASTTSDKYHRPDCRYAEKIKSENRIEFFDVWEAREAGYSPCKVCNPE